MAKAREEGHQPLSYFSAKKRLWLRATIRHSCYAATSGELSIQNGVVSGVSGDNSGIGAL
jgi:hypothetical protein